MLEGQIRDQSKGGMELSDAFDSSECLMVILDDRWPQAAKQSGDGIC